MGVMKTGTGRADRNVERFGDLRMRLAGEMVQGEDRALLHRESSKPAFQEVSIGDGEHLVRSRRTILRQDSEVDDPPSLSRGLGETHMDEEAAQPCVNSVRVAQAPEISPCGDERVLDGILGTIGIAEDPVGDREQPVGP